MTKKQIKEALAALTKPMLIDLVLDLLSVKGVRDRIENRFISGESRKEKNLALYEKACEDIYKAFHPARLHVARGCVAKSTKVINEFKAACPDKDLLADLLVYQIEMISKAFNGIEVQWYYNSMVNTTERNVKFLMKYGYVDKYLSRLRTALKGIDGEYDLV